MTPESEDSFNLFILFYINPLSKHVCNLIMDMYVTYSFVSPKTQYSTRNHDLMLLLIRVAPEHPK